MRRARKEENCEVRFSTVRRMGKPAADLAAGSKLIIPYDGYLLDSPNPYRLWFRVGFNSGAKDPSRGTGSTTNACCTRRKKSLPQLPEADIELLQVPRIVFHPRS